MGEPGLKTLLGDHAVTAALKQGKVASPRIGLEFVDVKVPNTAFKRVVRDLAFDVAELAIVTFLMAKARGVPLTLLPAVLLARFQHPYIVYDASRHALAPGDLAGRRVGMRSYTVTTAAWIRAILEGDYGVDLKAVRWVTFEKAHVAGFPDPPGVVRAPPGQDLLSMLRSGEVDAAIIGAPIDDPRIKTLIPDPAAAAQSWQGKHRAIQLNHLVAVKTALCEAHPEAVREIYRLLAASKRAAGLPPPGTTDLNPFGIEANRRNLEVAIDMTFRQGLIPRPFAVDDLFDPVVRDFA
jgi:4,5-dihydroxyphthalate decarboxylase